MGIRNGVLNLPSIVVYVLTHLKCCKGYASRLDSNLSGCSMPRFHNQQSSRSAEHTSKRPVTSNNGFRSIRPNQVRNFSRDFLDRVSCSVACKLVCQRWTVGDDLLFGEFVPDR